MVARSDVQDHGVGGVAITGSAYLVNPAKEGDVFGLPSIGVGSVYTRKGSFFGFATVTETLWDRIELGYGFNVFNLHDLPMDIQSATGIVIADDRVFMHNFNARFALLKENQFDLPWLPAFTFGVHYKFTDKLDDIDQSLGGALTQAGIPDRHFGIDEDTWSRRYHKRRQVWLFACAEFLGS